jgi:DNA-binding MarR family transcriptional regulator
MSQPRSPQFGAILFRASVLIGDQGAAVFERLGIGLHADKISIVLALHTHGPQSSTQLSQRIGHSRQLIETRLKPSVADGFFVSMPDPTDSRRRIYDFSDAARPEVARIIAVMLDFETVYAELWAETGIDLEAGLLAMERALDRRDLTARLADRFPQHAETLEEMSQ